MKKATSYFTTVEKSIWLASVLLTSLSFFLFDRSDFVTLFSSVFGITAIMFNAKGNPVGQFLMIVFALVYGMISFSFAYYGEMITYIGMTLPMSVVALIAWLKNPFNGNKKEVRVHRIVRGELVAMLVYALFVTIAFYFILAYFNTKNLIPSTLSVTTSFIAVYLTYKRSPLFGVAFALNDVVLIVLWALASLEDISYIPMVTCFVAFLVNDVYGFFNWLRMEKRQKENG